MIRTIMLWGICALLLAACSSSPSIPDMDPQAPLKIADGARARPVRFGKVAMTARRGDIVGEAMSHLACIYESHIAWGGGVAEISDRDMKVDFYAALRAANIPAAGDLNDLYEDPSISSIAELEVSGLIDQFWLNICFPDEDRRRVKGGAVLRVTWQIRDPIANKTVYKVSTMGAYKDYHTGENDSAGMIAGAFNMAVTNLLADHGFHDLVLSDPLQELTAKPGYRMLEMTPPAGEQSLTNARAATVTIFSSTGTGSGVIVSPDGYVLTAYHVIKEGKVARVRLSTDREVMGNVIRVDPVRDVALIKLAEDHLPAVAVRTRTEPEVGEPVFAIGSPLGVANDNTTTQGIVSTYRTVGGLKFIQSDVSIQHGNSGGPLVDQYGLLIGLCDQMRVTEINTSEGLNFFVPIGETMGRLKLGYPAAAIDSGHMQ